MKLRAKVKGFTIVELAIVLIIAGLLLVLAVPSYQSITQDNRIITQSNNFIASVNYARSEAIRRGTFVSICASSTGTNCTGVNWSDGWIVFTDNNSAGTLDGTDQILQVYSGSQGDVSFDLPNASYIQFQPIGFINASRQDTPFSALVQYAHYYQKKSLALLVKALPVKSANASSSQAQDSTADTNSNTNDEAQNTSSTVVPPPSGTITINVCDAYNTGSMGRTITISPSGRTWIGLNKCQ